MDLTFELVDNDTRALIDLPRTREWNAQSISELVQALCGCLARMKPVVPYDPPPFETSGVLPDSGWSMKFDESRGESVVSIRHPSLGWLRYAFSSKSRTTLIALLQDHERLAREPIEGRVLRFPDLNRLRGPEGRQEHVTEEQQKPSCSFCGKTQHEVEKLIAGPGVWICDGCISICSAAIRNRSSSIRPADLVIGQIYYRLQPDTDNLHPIKISKITHPIITTYKYKGKTDDGQRLFEAVGGPRERHLTIDDSNLSSLVDYYGLWENIVFGE